MNILYIVHDNKKGGAAISFLDMLRLVSKEHNVYVLTPHKKGFIPDKLKEMGIWYHDAHFFWWKIAVPDNKVLGAFRICMYKVLNVVNYIEAHRMTKQILKMNIDIIHTNSSVINFGALLSKKTGIPHVWHLREYGKEDFNLVPVIAEHKINEQMKMGAKRYIAISDSIKDKFSEIVSREKIVRIYNGINRSYNIKKTFEDISEECNKSSEHENYNRKVKFLIAGNYCREKGQIDAALAAKRLWLEGIKDFELYLAGNGGFEEIKDLVKENELEEVIHILGRVDNMMDLRKRMDVEIVASQNEAFGRVTVEAMKASMPVIGTRSGGTLELITENQNGFLFDYMNNEELSVIMKNFIQNQNLIKSMGMNAYDSMKDAFTPEENFERINALYKEIVLK